MVPFRNRDEGGEGSLVRSACQYQRQWFRVKLTITEPQMEPQGGRVLLLPEALAISGLKGGLKLSGCEDHSRVFMAAAQKIKLAGTED